MSSDDIVLSVNNISKCFEVYSKPRHRLQQMLFGRWKTYYREFWALRDINFEVRRGECVGVIGRNGAGKSTLLQIVTGTLQPTTGTVERKGRIAALLELGSGFNPEFTGRENVYMNAAILGLTKKETDAKYREIVDFADIGDFVDQPVKTYSSGMMVRLAFAVQVMVDPDILIVDEALAVGDAAFQRKCYARLEKLIAKGMTLFLVTHDTEVVKRLCSRAIFLKDHRIDFNGNAADGVLRYMQNLFPAQSSSNASASSPTPPGDTSAAADGKYCYVWNHPAERDETYGLGGGRITQIRIAGLIRPNLLPASGKMRIEIDASWDGNVLSELAQKYDVKDRLYLGYCITNARNIKFFGCNTCSENVPIDIGRGHVTVAFEFDAPALCQGDYFVSAALSLGEVHNGQQLDWNDFSIHLVSENDVRGGFIRIPNKVEVVDE